MVTAPRSTGSIMKPFLYAGLLSSGQLLPNALIPDIPTRFQGFRPENADFTYSGAVPAGDALARSLNIPAVRMLQMYEEERFLILLRQMGFTTFTKPASHYGLSLILGGGEATSWELASGIRIDGKSPDHQSQFANANKRTFSRQSQIANPKSQFLLSPLLHLAHLRGSPRVNRPGDRNRVAVLRKRAGGGLENRHQLRLPRCMGHRHNTSYVVAVWAGNADGEGRPGLSGIASAAPLLFDIIRLLPPSASWFARPEEGMTLASLCAASGYRAGPDCPETREEWIPETGLRSDACPYHTVVTLDPRRHIVSTACASPREMVARSWFILPPAMEYFYRMRNPVIPHPAALPQRVRR
jgi:penicillin-binding protein 1C